MHSLYLHEALTQLAINFLKYSIILYLIWERAIAFQADSFLYKICPFRVLRSKLSDLFQLKLMLVKKKKRSFSERKHIFKLNLEELKGAG